MTSMTFREPLTNSTNTGASESLSKLHDVLSQRRVLNPPHPTIPQRTTFPFFVWVVVDSWVMVQVLMERAACAAMLQHPGDPEVERTLQEYAAQSTQRAELMQKVHKQSADARSGLTRHTAGFNRSTSTCSYPALASSQSITRVEQCAIQGTCLCVCHLLTSRGLL